MLREDGFERARERGNLYIGNLYIDQGSIIS